MPGGVLLLDKPTRASAFTRRPCLAPEKCRTRRCTTWLRQFSPAGSDLVENFVRASTSEKNADALQFCPGHEHNCPNMSHCLLLGGAALRTFVLMANEQELSRGTLHATLDSAGARGERRQCELDQAKTQKGNAILLGSGSSAWSQR